MAIYENVGFFHLLLMFFLMLTYTLIHYKLNHLNNISNPNVKVVTEIRVSQILE